MNQIKIYELLPLLRPGWVAMDADNTWWWYDVKPNANAAEPPLQWCGVGCDAISLSDLFDIAPFDWDWTDSLMECGCGE